MRFYKILIMAMLYLFCNLELHSQILEKKITLQFGKTTVGVALKKVKQAYGVRFSYANNIIPENREINVNVKNLPLRELLDKLFEGTSISYQMVGEQVVLKRDRLKVRGNSILKPVLNRDSSLVKSNVIPENIEKEDYYVSNENLITPDTVERITMEYHSIKEDDPKSKKELRRIYRLEKKKLRKMYEFKKDSLEKTDPAATSAIYKKFKETIDNLKEEVSVLKDSLHNLPLKVKNILNKDSLSDPVNDSIKYKKAHYQITFVTPIGTNGHDAVNTVNKFSLNVVGGVAAGLEGIEFGWLANVERDYVHGFQFSGFANIVKNEVKGGQFAGYLNVAGKNVRGPQLAGFANICGSNMTGVQGAGFCSINNGSFKGVQGSGFCNVNNGTVKGLQMSGFCNVNSDSLTGAQFAGFANINPKNVKGVQVAGFLNVAKNVNGVQLGFLNIADSIKGIPIGFLSIVRKGYRRVEIYGSESMYGNIAFKTGVRHFYNILYLGGLLENNYYRWAFGYGLGSELKLAKRLALNLDLLSMHINENEGFTSQLNLLNQVRATLGVCLSKRTYLFLGPTLNVMVSQFVNFDDNSVGSKIGTGNLYNHTESVNGNLTNIKMWVGLNGGIRF